MADLQQLVKELSALTVMEAAELSKQLETTWGVSAAVVSVAAASPASGAAAEAEEEKTHFDVTLVAIGEKKISVIKEIRVINSSINLMEAKELVEKLPALIKKDASKEEAEKFKKLLEDAGAKVELK
jgi:large subunit ribosomal protein L7/L12